MTWDAHETGDFVSTDQYLVNTSGRLLLSPGKEPKNNQFHCGATFHNAATGLMWTEN